MPRLFPRFLVLLFALSAAALPADLTIPQIQGSGLSSPVEGQQVTTRGNIVTAVASDGFFIQADAGGDANPETSDGIFVFTATAPAVAAGDRVDVTGVAKEYFGLTEIEPGTVTIVSRNHAVPAALDLHPTADPARAELEMERLEGMLVRARNALAVSGTDRFGDFYAVAEPAARPFREAGVAYPGLPSLPMWDGNREIFEIDTDRIGPGAGVIGGALIELAEGPLGYAFGDYQIWATTLAVTNPTYPRPVRPRATGEMTIASQNLLRLVDDNTAVLALRLGKFSLLIREVLRSPDVLAVSEAENLQVLESLASRIAADDPGIRYQPYLLEGNDPSSIDVGFLVRDTVSVASAEQVSASETFTFDGRTYTLFDRPPLLLRASYVANGSAFPFAAIAVHLRSLNDIETSEFARVKRHRGALRLAERIRDLLAAEPGLRLVVTGDFNAFEVTDGFVDVMGQITGAPDPRGALIPVEPVQGYAGLRNETFTVRPEDRYSYVYEGTAQVLDHALASPGLVGWVRELQFGRANADAPEDFATDGTTRRASDHDATVLFVMTDRDADGVPDDREPCPPATSSSARRRLVRIGCP